MYEDSFEVSGKKASEIHRLHTANLISYFDSIHYGILAHFWCWIPQNGHMVCATFNSQLALNQFLWIVLKCSFAIRDFLLVFALIQLQCSSRFSLLQNWCYRMEKYRTKMVSSSCSQLKIMWLLPAEIMHVNMTVNCFGRSMQRERAREKKTYRKESNTIYKNVRNLSIHLSTSDLNSIRMNATRHQQQQKERLQNRIERMCIIGIVIERKKTVILGN